MPRLIFVIVCAALIAIAAVSVAGAKDAKVLGKTKHTPRPACPKDTQAKPCSAVGSVTAFMRTADGKRFPFKVKRDGKLVAWAIKVSRPTKKQRNFFGNIFKSNKWGKAPTARIAVLRQSERKRRKYKLLRQSRTVNLSGVLGRKQIITLDEPLRVQKGLTVALTIPTWASTFATPVSSADNKWRASRKSGECDTSKIPIAKKSRPQQKVGSVRKYGCDYTAARLLYWAYYVPN
jgi:hypothetical protein